MSNKRNGRKGKELRKARALDRAEHPTVLSIFGAHETCQECLADKLVGHDCQTPLCKSLREEESVFYKSITEDRIEYNNGAVLEAGLDY